MATRFRLITYIVLLSILTSILLYEAWHDAGTYDEVGHITAGYAYTYLHDFRLYPDNPPLIKMLAVLPWWPLQGKIKFPIDAPEYTRADTIDWWKLGTKFLYQSGNDADLLIFLARLPMIVLTLALGGLVAKMATDLYGKRAGLFALFLYTLEPNIRAYGHLVITDVGATFFILLTLYLLVKALISPEIRSDPHLDRRNWILGGITFGLALLSKYSMIFFLPIIIIFLAIFVIRRYISLKKGLLLTTYYLLLTYATLWIISFLIGYHRVNFRFEDVPLNKSAREKLGNRLTWKIFHLLPVPYYYQVGLETMYARNVMGQPSFLFGQVNPNGNWKYYFLLTYLVKTPIPILIFIIAAFWKYLSIMTYGLRFKSDRINKQFINHKLSFILLPTVLFFLIVSFTGNLSIGLRFIFPSLILFLIFASSIMSWIRFTKKNMIGILSLCLWLIFSNVVTLPYDLSYVNELGGGTWGGYQVVSDSSYDWGQDLKRFATWVKQTVPGEKLTLSYLGTADPAYYGISYQPLKFENLSDLSGLVAISATNLELAGRYIKDQDGKVTYDSSPLQVFYRKDPSARIGTTIFVYRFP